MKLFTVSALVFFTVATAAPSGSSGSSPRSAYTPSERSSAASGSSPRSAYTPSEISSPASPSERSSAASSPSSGQQTAAERRAEAQKQRQAEQKARQEALQLKLQKAKEEREAAAVKRQEELAKAKAEREAEQAAKQKALQEKLAKAKAEREAAEAKRKEELAAKLAKEKAEREEKLAQAKAQREAEQAAKQEALKEKLAQAEAEREAAAAKRKEEQQKKNESQNNLSPETPAPLLVNIPVNQAMNVQALEQFNNKVNANAIINHGCHCSKYSRTENVGGSPVDELDAGCQDWNKKINCLSMEGGSCENGVDFGMIPVQLQQNGNLSPDADFGCAFTENKCQFDMCQIYYQFGAMLMDSVNQNGPGSDQFKGYSKNAQCMPNVPSYGDKMCVGQAPDVNIVIKEPKQNKI